ncbi:MULTISPECIES: DUF2550 domain-containing protein [Nocardia]|uniref:DUF2550 domain-containing protein n=2 Tax=Nocardia TaxID=1817 RepID=A0A285LUV2_9NOCA|nr:MULTISPECIES: DUF2550 domain-containing protein [Nocardia]MCP2277355.1 Protein of unknown function (DUF2550) [Nocardia amikacinitolerans]MCP2289013.1 Protein of unknown function (DUF2550) [Nocardia amikacinitolerans]MCP2295314.1 Protein of unknown function (DUF2550) [Nocardia amikacinitolerans]MCP2319134.1 Protein of unknown function (DUF2550) [Nocardia amikacinitolerans]TQM28460.1 uncharacterized protein DUF2550 [Nocardia bhagyanarayanae]
MVVLIILVLLLVALALISVYRLIMLRRGGTAAILRVLPANGGQGWRHGLIRYDEDRLVFFKLTSLKIGPDATIRRRGIEVGDRRGPRGDEYDIMTDEIIVTEVADTEGNYELALDRGARAAFLSWVESRPSDRTRRMPGL